MVSTLSSYRKSFVNKNSKANDRTYYCVSPASGDVKNKLPSSLTRKDMLNMMLCNVLPFHRCRNTHVASAPTAIPLPATRTWHCSGKTSSVRHCVWLASIIRKQRKRKLFFIVCSCANSMLYLSSDSEWHHVSVPYWEKIGYLVNTRHGNSNYNEPFLTDTFYSLYIFNSGSGLPLQPQGNMECATAFSIIKRLTSITQSFTLDQSNLSVLQLNVYSSTLQ